VPVTGEPRRDALRCQPDAAYLITGGLGALGLLMAGWLADRGARRILLAARTPLPPRRGWDEETDDSVAAGRITAIRALERRGVSVEVVPLDVGLADDVQALIARRDREGAPPVRGIIHAAGVTHDQLVMSITDDAMRQVMWPKIAGAQVLHEAFPCGSVDFFFLTASAASTFGIPGQGSYAAANAYLDALARARHRQGCHTVSIGWAAWRGLGFASDAPIVSEALQRLGSRELLPDEAFTAWDYVHRRDVAQAVVVPQVSNGRADSPVSDGQPLLSNTLAWSQMPPAEIRTELTARIRAVIARELPTTESDVQTDRPFIELGLNSMMALSIRREIEHLVGLELSATMLWNHPTVDALAAYLAEKLMPADEMPADVIAAAADPAGRVLESLFERIESTPSGSETAI
jgi:phthiocerol/phenolphthiocerol synthesis type-I polyketide synthase A